MSERGIENLFMLSGGLKVIAQKFPEGLTTGTFPASCPQNSQPGSGRRRTVSREPSYPAENKWRFTAEDLDKIQHYLEEMLIPTDSASHLSRVSTGRAYSTASSARSSQAPSVAGSASARSERSSTSSRPWK
uniref:Uncharacterized protein n=2 Tax=Latimeria chalumnae TaxID=7897 RepID=H2ZSS3_LATCH|nr:PREDICTED: centrosomal protein of 41 kDa [Latimeria chalumnae]|eukprot:XP_006012172.1 PREDICTED: centrosomal protein of 41 kDa [Latimeria chalumnae]